MCILCIAGSVRPGGQTESSPWRTRGRRHFVVNGWGVGDAYMLPMPSKTREADPSGHTVHVLHRMLPSLARGGELGTDLAFFKGRPSEANSRVTVQALPTLASRHDFAASRYPSRRLNSESC